MLVEVFLERLEAGIWQLGDRLPSEREICEEYGVSRTVVREALSALQLAGYIQARAGDGNYVIQSPAVEQKTLDSPIQAGLSVIEAIEAREAMDISAVHLAIENATDEDLERPAQVVGEMERAVAHLDYHTYINLTLDFHLALAEAGGNSFIQQAVAFLIDQIRPSLWVIEQNYNRKIAQDSFNVHRAIFQAVKNRDLEAAIRVVRAHYRNYPAIGHSHPPQPIE